MEDVKARVDGWMIEEAKRKDFQAMDMVFSRMSHLYNEWRIRRGGTDCHPSMLSFEVRRSELAKEVVELSKAFTNLVSNKAAHEVSTFDNPVLDRGR